MRSLDLGLYELSTNEKFVVVGWGGWCRLGVTIESNLNRVRLSCCWVGVGLVLGWVVTIYIDSFAKTKSKIIGHCNNFDYI